MSQKIEVLENSQGEAIVLITNEDGSTVSMSKDVYDAQQAEHLNGNDSI